MRFLRPALRDAGPPPPTRGPRPAAPPLARAASGVVADLARKTRFVDPDLAARWSEFAGPEISRICRPGRLTGGGASGRSLEVIVPHGAAAASVEFAAETLRRRLNGYFGPNAIERILIIQGPAPAGEPRPRFSRFRG